MYSFLNYLTILTGKHLDAFALRMTLAGLWNLPRCGSSVYYGPNYITLLLASFLKWLHGHHGLANFPWVCHFRPSVFSQCLCKQCTTLIFVQHSATWKFRFDQNGKNWVDVKLQVLVTTVGMETKRAFGRQNIATAIIKLRPVAQRRIWFVPELLLVYHRRRLYSVARICSKLWWPSGNKCVTCAWDIRNLGKLFVFRMSKHWGEILQ